MNRGTVAMRSALGTVGLKPLSMLSFINSSPYWGESPFWVTVFCDIESLRGFMTLKLKIPTLLSYGRFLQKSTSQGRGGSVAKPS